MPGSPSPESTGPSGRRLALVACCLVAVMAGGVLVATVGSSGLAGSPIDSVLPGEDISDDQTAGGDDPLGDGEFGDKQAGLGSLTPGAATGVGGELGLDEETFASTDTEIHFVAESSQPTYYRTAAFDAYTGSGWERDASTEPYDPPLHDTGFDQIEYNITLEQPATALPTPWRPTAVGGLDEDSLGVTPAGSVHTDEQLPEGTAFTGVSHGPEDNPDLLQSAGDSHPDEIDPYTELPDDIAPRVGVRTANIVGDADSRYEAVMAVQNWLRSDKEYSLDAHRETDNIAETFIFEMDAGYCEYFATAMATMLRTQDIPTRYAVGYSSGQPVGNDSYQVRAMNAHAWVEVYFEGIGWVQFDPTPAGPRLQAQQAALEAVGEEYNVTEPTNPGETFDFDDLEDEENETDDGWGVDLDRTPIPGESVEVTVTWNGEVVPGVEVRFDGEAVGTTDDDGRVTATAPQAEDFEIALFPSDYRLPLLSPDDSPAERPDHNRTVASGAPAVPGGTLSAGVSTNRPDDDSPVRTDPETNESDDLVTTPDEPAYNETISIETEASVEISGEVVPGNEVGVTAVLGADALADATVFLDGETVAETDEAGWATVTLPASEGSVTIAVERDPIAGEVAVDVPPFDVAVEVEWPVAVPFAPATVEATYGEDPAVGVPVEVDGEQVATTGTDGEATVRLPVGLSADIAAVQHGVRAETSVGGLLVNLLLGGMPVVGLLAGGGYLLARRGGHSADGEGGVGPVDRLRASVGRLVGLATRALVAGAGRGDSLLAAAGASIRDTVGLVLVALGLRAPTASADRRGGSATPGRVPVAGEESPRTADQERVRAAWGEFLAHVSAPAATHTPGELAAHAIEQDGLPAESVGMLRDAFRAVEYGNRSVEVDRVQTALAAIESAGTADDTGGSER